MFFFLSKSFCSCRCLLAALRDHPLLLTCQKRIQFLVFALVLLKFKIPEWRCLYDREYQLDVQQRKKVEGPVPWLKKFKGDPNYKEIVENPNASYSASPSSEAVFARNAIVHINDGKIRVCLLTTYYGGFFGLVWLYRVYYSINYTLKIVYIVTENC